jgi:glutamyl-tRNA synthetase
MMEARTPPLAQPERGRFAPSPTGELHLGNARTALLAWLWSRSSQGRFILRVEDLDQARVRPGLAQRQLDELRWLGLDWDEGPDPLDGLREAGAHGPYRQSERTALYAAAIDCLRAAGHVYECFCSRAEIASAASAPHGIEGDGPRYPGTCATLTSVQRAVRSRLRAPALRLRVAPGMVSFVDAIEGPQEVDVQAQTGDFVLRRADGVFAYQLAVVVDDAAMGVTQVLRGADLLPSTARQILLYRLLGVQPPRFAHAPLVLGRRPSGETARLSKREAASSLSALRAAKTDPRRIVGLLGQLSGLVPPSAAPRMPPEPALATAPACTPADLVPIFALGKVPAEPAYVPEIIETV